MQAVGVDSLSKVCGTSLKYTNLPMKPIFSHIWECDIPVSTLLKFCKISLFVFLQTPLPPPPFSTSLSLSLFSHFWEASAPIILATRLEKVTNMLLPETLYALYSYCSHFSLQKHSMQFFIIG